MENDVVRYTVVIYNSGSGYANNGFYSDTPDENTTLVVGSVTTSRGIVVTGNDEGDTIIEIDTGFIPHGISVTITYEVVVNEGTPEGTMIVNQEPATIDNLQQLLEDQLMTISDDKLYLKADQELEYGKLVDIYDIIKAAGIEEIGIIVDPATSDVE